MIEFFPRGKQQQIRSILAGVLRGVVCSGSCRASAAAASRRSR